MNVVINSERVEVDSNSTVASLLVKLDLDRRPVAVELNEDVVPRERRPTTVLREGDRLEIVTLVGGG